MNQLLFVAGIISIFYVRLSCSLPVIVGHRGASGHRPENTLASWDKAIEFGADYIEADFASTKDHVLIATHNPDITHTTDVAERSEFASKYTTKNVSGEIYEGYFVDDFTVAELKSLRSREHHKFRNQIWNDMYSMPTLNEFLSFIRAKEKEHNKPIGIYVETKHPSYYRSVGLPLEEILVETLHRYGYRNASDLVFIQSFETNLKEISKMTNLSLVQLVSGTEGDKSQFDTGRRWKDITSAAGLREIATYAQGVGPHKSCVFKMDSHTGTPTETTFIQDAHDAGLLVHVWTFRKEREHFEKHESKMFGAIEDEMRAFFDVGVDGIFTDFPDIGIRVREEMYSSEDMSLYMSVIVSILATSALYQVSRSLRRVEEKKRKEYVPSSARDELSNSY